MRLPSLVWRWQSELTFSELEDGTRLKINASGYTIFGVITRTGLKVTRIRREGIYRFLQLDPGDTVEIDQLVSGSITWINNSLLEDLQLFTKPP